MNFEAIRASSDTIAALLCVTDEGQTMATMTTMVTARWVAARQDMMTTTKDDDDDGAMTTTTTTTTRASNNNEAIQNVLATFNRESQCAVEYVVPQDQVLHEGYEGAMSEKFACVFKEMKTTGEMKSLVVIERDYLNHLSEKFREAHLTRSVGERLFMKKNSKATIYVLVIVSYHVIAGARVHK